MTPGVGSGDRPTALLGVARRLAAAAAVLGALALTGCSAHPFLELTAAESDIDACAISSEPLPVESLDTPERPACLPLGSSLVFPDGAEVAVSEQGGAGSSSDGDVDHGWFSVGIYGMVATSWPTDDCAALQVWGRAEAIEKLRDAFGDGLGQC